MSKITFIIGGARSGKSRHAQELARGCGAGIVFIATGEAKDEEMERRIRIHRDERPQQWATVEEPRDLAAAVRGVTAGTSFVIIDCLTLWVSNLVCSGAAREAVEDAIRGVVRELKAIQARSIVISNEVGMGIVPENRLARMFRDLSGEANELLASVADEIHVVFAGIPLKLKG